MIDYSNVNAMARWLPCEYAALGMLFAQGKDDIDIGEKLKRSTDSVRKKRIELRLLRQPRDRKWTPEKAARLREAHDAGWSKSEAGRAIGISDHSVRAWSRRMGLNQWSTAKVNAGNGKFFTMPEMLKVVKLLSQGYQPAAISRQLPNRNRNSVSGFVFRNREKLMALARAQSVSGPQTGGANG